MKRIARTVDSFRRFVESTGPRFMSAAYVLLGERVAAEDAMQIALLRTYCHWEQVLANPGGYMWRVLVNVCRNERRRRGRLPEMESLESEPASLEALDNAVAARHDLLTVLKALPYNQREAVVLRYYLGLSVSETAQVLSLPEGTVKSMTARALGHLKRDLSTRSLEVHDVER
jgi:RNA polymerase sigma-70 factor (sigma-E family)